MKIIIFDDDPTGSQTVYGCPLLLTWDEKTLKEAFKQPSNLIFILANTRSLSPHLAEKKIREICLSLKDFFIKEKLLFKNYLFISRGDSTLRGHGFLEPHILMDELGAFNATFHIPAFFEGGRTTENRTHLLNGLPVHLTDFARDKIFGYSTSDLAEWLEEKSFGEILSENIFHISIKQLDRAINSDDGFLELFYFISNLEDNVSVVVDAAFPKHLEIFVKALRLTLKDKRFLFRTAASFINSLAELPPNPCSVSDLVSLKSIDQESKYKPGLVMVGSHVQLATEQLNILLRENKCEGLEISVKELAQVFKEESQRNVIPDMESFLMAKITNILTKNKTPVLYTTRDELHFSSDNERMKFGLELAEFMANLVGNISHNFGYIISKGGITTQLLLKVGLNMNQVSLQGQILPGLSMVRSFNEYNNLPVITFPGNLGDNKTLLESWKIMESSNKI